MSYSVENMYFYLKHKYLPFLFAVPLFFSVYHYGGIVMDAILYVTQYVFSIDPSRFLGDPAFEFGNQDSMGFFSPILGIFIEWMGVSEGAFVYTVAMQFAWIIGAVFMIKALMRLTRQRLWILPVTILFVAFFANGMPFSHIRWFQYVPLYACSRSLSMVLGISGLALLFGRKRGLSLLLIIAGTLVHPITAGWCLPFWVFYLFPITRIPVLVFSIVFPATFLLHQGVFDLLSEDWLARPLAFASDYEVASRFILLMVFFCMQTRLSKSREVKRISISMSLLLLIAFYWDVCGGYGEHVLLYQAQSWRAVWLPSLIAVPLGICVAKDSFKRIKRNRVIGTHDFAWLMLIISFAAPRNIILISAIAAVLLIRKNKQLVLKKIAFIFAGFVLVGYLVQQYHTWCLQGLGSFFGYNYQDFYRIRDSFLVYQLVLSVFFVFYFLKNKRVPLAAALVFYMFFSQFMLLPLLPLFVFCFPKLDKRKLWGGIVLIFVLTLFDGMFDVAARRQSLFGGFPLSFPYVLITTMVSLLVIYWKSRFSYSVTVIWLSLCSIFAMVHYGLPCANILKRENQLNEFLHKLVFPQVKVRGDMLYYVSGNYVGEPRLQFMTGTYFTGSVDIGGIFNKKHYRTALERSHLLYKKELDPQSQKFYTISDILNKFANADTLADRVSFLCGNNEISHIVTDKIDLPFGVEDSIMTRNNQKIFLYGCPK